MILKTTNIFPYQKKEGKQKLGVLEHYLKSLIQIITNQ